MVVRHDVRAAERGQVEVVIRALEQAGPGAVGGIGMQDGVAVAEEDADRAGFARPAEVGLADLDQLLRNGSILPIGARDTAANVMSRACR